MMESDINADQNFYRRPHHVPLSSSSDHDQQQQHHDHHTSYNSPPTHTDIEARSPKVPPKLSYLTTQNLHAVTSNGYVGGAGGGDPDDFYKQYRGVQSSSNGYGDSPNGMAATVSESRPGPSSLRSNSNGTTPKHPPVSGLRNGLKQPGYRSASSPLDGRTALSNAKSSPALNGASNSSQKPSVKDLLKRFDQNNQPSAAPAVRKPAPRIPPKDVSTSSTAYARTRAVNGSPNTLGNTRAGQATRDAGVGAGNHSTVPRTTQRTRFATEDQHSNNTLSSTARTTKPRIAVPGSNGFSSKSMSNLSPTSQTHPQSPPAPRRPLFGEVSATGTVNLPDVGYSLTGQTNVRRLAHSRSRSDIVEAIPPSPASPTAWYRSVNQELGSGLPQRSPRLLNGHNRAHSDSPDAKANPLKNINTSSLKTGLPRPSPTKLSPHTRIPTVASRFNTPSNSSSPSPPSTRAVSPYAAKSAANTKLRKPDPRSTTPTGGRAQTPTNRTPRGKARSPGNVGTNNASLKAYISSPPPKTSPPLRSSRPRQPVSSASTASSRPKTRERSQSAVRERAGSPKAVRTGMRVTRTNSTPSSRDESPKPRRILTTGPVDFAARREKVQRAYTKSIHASEQKEIRARNLQRLNERRAAEAKSKKEAEVLTAEIAAPENLPTEASEAAAEPLQVTTNFSPPNWTPPVIQQASVIQQIPPDVDSPTLGIPGSFPGEKNVDEEIEEPQSAISNATGVTEIDVEPQTAPAQMSVLPSDSSVGPSMLSQEAYVPESSAETTPQLPEEVHEDVQEAPQIEVQEEVHEESHDESAIPIFIDATPVETSIPSPLPSPKSPNPPGAFMQDTEYMEYDEPLSPYDPLARDPSPPGAFHEESPELTPDLAEHDQPVFATTITSASPLATPEPPELQEPQEHPEARTPPESGDEREFVDDTIHAEVVIEDLSQSTCSDLAPAEYDSPTAEEFAVQDQDEDESKAPHLRLPMLRSALSAQRDSDYLMTPTTDIDYESSNEHSSVSGQRDVSQSQNRDQLSPGMYYDKRHSVWTDFSVNSGDEFSDQEYYEHYPLDLALKLSDPEKKPIPPLKTSPVVPPKPDNYTPQASPRFLRETPHLESPHQLPPVSTGTGLGLGFAESTLGYGSQVTSVVPLWPEYSPPAVPVEDTAPAVPAPPTRTPPPPSIYNRGPSSSIHRSSQYESRRPSEDVYSPRPSTSTPRSSAQMSAEDVSTAHQSFADVAKQVERLMTNGTTPSVPTAVPDAFETEEDRIAAEKEKKRLYQRMRIIKELIETEAVYLKDMNVVEEIYKGTAEACPKLEETDVKSIFRNTDEVVAFTTTFLDELKAAGSSVFTTRKPKKRESQATTATANRFSTAETLNQETDDQKDRKTFIGRTFGKHLKQMQEVYTDFLKNSEIASTRLTALQADPAVKVWLQECNLVAKDLTAAWSLDALLVKPVQRITRYKLLLADLAKHTTENHPDYQSIQTSMAELDSLLKNIDDLKRRIDMVGKIVGRKRKESDVRSGIAKAFGRRAEKLQSSNSHRPNDDETYLKLHEKYQDDYLRLQVVLRDVEFYTRQSSSYVNDFLRYLSSIELVMRLSASPYPEIESKWARFNMGMRDMGTVALEEHLQSVRQRVIQPFEQVIQAYSAPGLAMKKRNKRRLDYEKSLQLKNSGKKIDEKLSELVDQYEALNETLKFELPKLSQLTEKIGNICLGHFVTIQAHWFNIWQEKVKVVLEESQMAKEIGDIVDMFARDYKYVEARAQELGIVNGTFLDSSPKTARASQSTRDDGASMTSKGRPSNISSRSRGLSIRSDTSPSLPTPDFAKRNSGQFTFSPILSQAPGLPAFAPRDPSFSNGHSRAGSGSPATPNSDSPNKYGAPSVPRPGTGRSFTSSDGLQRPSNDYNEPHRRQSGSTYNSNYHIDGPPQSGRPYSGLFHSAMPLPDGPDDSQRSSRASSRDRNVSGGYNVLYLAASLFEFNISATKSEAGYPYLTYQAGEIFDVIGEKGELWLAKNQDDPTDSVGWIWSKHFARLATD